MVIHAVDSVDIRRVYEFSSPTAIRRSAYSIVKQYYLRYKPMETLTNNDLDHVLDFLRQLYSPCSLDDFPAQVLSALSKLSGAEIFLYTCFNMQKPTMARCYTFPVVEIGSAMESISVDHNTLASHPALNDYFKSHNEQVHTISDVVSEQKTHRIEPWYTDYFQRFEIQDELGFILEMPCAPEFSAFHRGQDLLALVLCHDRRNFTEHDRFLLSLIQPYLKQAYENVSSFNHVQHQLTQQRQATEQTGMIALSIDGTLQWMTQKAGTLLHQYFPPSKAHISIPDLLQCWIKQQQLAQAQVNIIPTPPSSLHIEQNGNRLTIRLNLDVNAMQIYLLLEETQPERFSPASLEMLGLTKREAEVLFEAAKDQNTKEIANHLGISDRTAKKHLEHIYAKLGVQTRTGAIMYALQTLGIVSP